MAFEWSDKVRDKLQRRQLDGKWTGWYRNGQIKSEINYKDGKQDGKWTGWYENGQIAYEANYINGKPDGKWTEWWGNGQLKSERNYKDGKLDGKWTGWHENGQLQLERIFQDGKLVLWDENSQSKEAYKDGKLLAPLAPWYERYWWLWFIPLALILLLLVYAILRVRGRHTSSKKTREENQVFKSIRSIPTTDEKTQDEKTLMKITKNTLRTALPLNQRRIERIIMPLSIF